MRELPRRDHDKPAGCSLSLRVEVDINRPPWDLADGHPLPGSTASGIMQGQEEEQLKLAIIRGARFLVLHSRLLLLTPPPRPPPMQPS